MVRTSRFRLLCAPRMSPRESTPLAGPLVPLRLADDPGGLGKGLTGSIGKKYLVGWTGLIWCGFLLVHMAGNAAVFFGAEALNVYAAKLASLGVLLYAVEIGLAVLLAVHAGLAVLVTLENRAARPVGYAMDRGKGGRTWASRTMIWSGLFVGGFLIVHLFDIKFADFAPYGPDGVPDVYGTMTELFLEPAYVASYVVAVIVLGFHVGHGLKSACRTIGIHGARITPKIEVASIAFGFLVAVGYGIIPVWSLLGGGGGP